MTNPSISRRYALIPIVLAVFFLLFYLVYSDIKNHTIEEFNKEQLILAQTASQGITSFFEDYESDLTFLSRIDQVIEFSDSSKKYLSNFYETHKKLIEAITQVDSKGIIQHTFPVNKSVIGEDISYQKHVYQIITTHKPVISDVFMSVQGYPAIALHVPIFKGDVYKGSLAILIPIDRLGKRYLEKISIRGSGNAWLLSENGVEIYCPIPGHTGKSLAEHTNNAGSATGLLERIRNESFGTERGVNQEIVVNGKTKVVDRYVVFYRAPLGNTYWTIMISYEEKDVYASLSRLRNRLIFIFILLFVVVLYYFYSISKVRTLLQEEAKRKQAEKTLQESEGKFRTFFDESPIGIELYNASGMQVDANKASLKMFGISDVSEVAKFNLFDGTSLDSDKIKRLRRGEQISYQSLFDFEKVKELGQYKTNKSGKAYFDYVITSLFNPGQKTINGYLLQVQDITERKRSEEDFLMLAHALRSINECVSITDMENRILFVNEAFSISYGYSAEELIGKKMDFLRSDNNSAELINSVLPATLNGGWRGELMNARKDGSEFQIYLSTSIIHDKEGKPLGLIGVASDITDQKRSEQELIIAKERAEESDRLKSAFLANMSHEIRTPMNGILGFSELLKEPDLTGEEQLIYISVIEKSGKRMLNIINDLVDISRIEAGQEEVTLGETKLNEKIEYLYKFFNPEAAKKGLQLSFHQGLSSAEATIVTDREKLYAILTNLIKNAIKYTDSGTIEFGYDLKEEQQHSLLQFYIKDTGIGIPQNRQQAIFERFVQADIEDRNARQGAGLGLSISKAYVEMLGGKLWLESEEGKGSTFYFTLPYRDLSSEKKSALTGENEYTSGGMPVPLDLQLKVLIAEDEETSDFLITHALQKFSREILHAKTGIQAVDICRNNPDINLIMMDIKMPDMDGYEATRQIRQFNEKVIIIAQTAFALVGDREKALESGCNDYISKPINKEKLLEIVFNSLKTV
jgi:PAS domain S-box-containing protein